MVETGTTVVMFVKKLNPAFQFSTGRFPQELAKKQLKPISSHLQSDTLLRDPWVVVSVGFDNGRVAGFTCPIFHFLPVAVVSRWIQKTSFHVTTAGPFPTHTDTSHKGNFQ